MEEQGTPARGFPETRRSAIEGIRSADAAVRERSIATLAAAYWRPVYKHIRLHWRRPEADAEDLTQEFFARTLERGWLDPFDCNKARFRTFLRVCVDGFVQNHDRAGRRLKRGGDVVHLDFAAAESEIDVAGAPLESPERRFEAEWVRSLFALGVDALRAECEASGKRIHFEIFRRYVLDAPANALTYAELGRELGISATQVTNHLAYCRREFRRLLLDKLREITASDDEFRSEARILLGADR